MTRHLRGWGYPIALALVAFLSFGPGWSARNGNGTYTVPNTFSSGSTITASGFNQNFSDLASEITNSVAADGQTTMTGALKAASGTVAAPGIAFGSDTDTGLYRIGANNIGIAAGGTKIVDVSSTGIDVTGTVKQNGASLVPAGTVMAYAGSTAPTGYLLSHGQAVSRTTYADLFTAIGTTYGPGDGSTTFTLPDYRGRLLAGKDDMGGSAASRITSAGSSCDGATLGTACGAQNVTIAQANLPSYTLSHTLSISDPGHLHNLPTIQTAPSAGTGSANSLNQSNSVGSAAGASSFFGGGGQVQANTTGVSLTGSITSGGSGTALNKMPPAAIANFIIKY